MSLTPDHFYTTSDSERDGAIKNFGYQQEGTACFVFPPTIAQPPGTVRWHRLYLGGKQHNHFYTTSDSERDGASQKFGYKKEGTACFVYPPDKPQPPNTIPLFRLYSNSQIDHFYTTSETERDLAVKKHGYTYEGISCYVYSNPVLNGLVKLHRLYDPARPKQSGGNSPGSLPLINFTYCVTGPGSGAQPQTLTVMARTPDEARAIIIQGLPNQSEAGWLIVPGRCFGQ